MKRTLKDKNMIHSNVMLQIGKYIYADINVSIFIFVLFLIGFIIKNTTFFSFPVWKAYGFNILSTIYVIMYLCFLNAVFVKCQWRNSNCYSFIEFSNILYTCITICNSSFVRFFGFW